VSHNGSEPPVPRLRTRTVGVIDADDDTVIIVEHVYEPEGATPCVDCGKPSHDPGMVGLIVGGHDDDDPVSVLLFAADALVLANRLTRAASLVLESEEAVPDIEREAARFAPAAGEDRPGE
jgi:hypothetical protein